MSPASRVRALSLVVLGAASSPGCATADEHASGRGHDRIYVDALTPPAEVIARSGMATKRVEAVFVLLQDATFPRIVELHDAVERAGYRHVGELFVMVMGDARCFVAMADAVALDVPFPHAWRFCARLWEAGVPGTVQPAGNSLVVFVPRCEQRAATRILDQMRREEGAASAAPPPGATRGSAQ
jgi:hypothetical protein